jgi:membrane associated rhomboid family serine protease
LNLGVEKIPVTHHITLIGAVGAVVFSSVAGGVVALIAAGVFGAISGLLGEVTQRLFYSHSGTHVDPPAMAIAIVMFFVAVLSIAGVLPNAGYL